MEKKNFKTLIKNDHKFSSNKYVQGRIFGIAEIICELYGGQERVIDSKGKERTRVTYHGGFRTNKDETIRYLQMKCTTEQYERFKALVEEHYPSLCEFYWEG